MAEMTEERARAILGVAIPTGERAEKYPGLDNLMHPRYEYLSYREGDPTATLDGEYTPDQLEAIAFWMRRHG